MTVKTLISLFNVNGKFNIKRFAISLLVSLGAGAIGALFSKDAKDIYDYLTLPPFAPPAQVFGIVWTILFIFIGIASYRIWMHGGAAKPEGAVKNALSYYLIQLVFNVLWSVLFFGLQLYEAAFADILILLFYIIITTVKFFKIDKTAGCLMNFYLIWSAFATVLNFSIILLN